MKNPDVIGVVGIILIMGGLFNPYYGEIGLPAVIFGVLLFIMSYEREPSSLKHPYRVWCPQCDKYVTGMSPETHPRKLPCPECGHKGMTTLSPEDRKSLRHAVETLTRAE